jgi:hypothetical protein
VTVRTDGHTPPALPDVVLTKQEKARIRKARQRAEENSRPAAPRVTDCPVSYAPGYRLAIADGPKPAAQRMSEMRDRYAKAICKLTIDEKRDLLSA